MCVCTCVYTHTHTCLDHKKSTKGTQENLEFIYKKLCIYPDMYNFSHLPSTLHWTQYTFQDVFSTAQNSF